MLRVEVPGAHSHLGNSTMHQNSSLMTGFPAMPENQVDLSNWRTSPYCSWAFHHVRELLPTMNVLSNPDPSQATTFVSDEQPINQLSFVGADNNNWTVEQLLKAGSTDAFMIIKDNQIISEQYFNGQQAHDPHVVFSVTKSVTAILAGILVEKGHLDPKALAIDYMPEAKDTAWSDCTIQHILDMTVGIAFDEDYEDMTGDVARYRRATGWDPQIDAEPQIDLRQFLLTLKSSGEPHGETFHYVSPNTDFIGWILERITQKPWAVLLSEYIWQPMGAKYDAYMTVDKFGAPRAAGGLCMTISDMARFASMMLNQGKVNNRQIVPQEWLNDILISGNTQAWKKGMFSELFPNGRYRNYWYLTGNENNAFCAIGIHGQWIYCDPENSLVIVRQSSQGPAVDDPYDHNFLAGCAAISDRLANY